MKKFDKQKKEWDEQMNGCKGQMKGYDEQIK
jgi:hypothetical protein